VGKKYLIKSVIKNNAELYQTAKGQMKPFALLLFSDIATIVQ
jgi:hypothetical protein